MPCLYYSRRDWFSCRSIEVIAHAHTENDHRRLSLVYRQRVFWCSDYFDRATHEWLVNEWIMLTKDIVHLRMSHPLSVNLLSAAYMLIPLYDLL